MNSLSKFSIYSIALVSSMSLLMVVGCTGNDNVKHNIDAPISNVMPGDDKQITVIEGEGETSKEIQNSGIESEDNMTVLMAELMPDAEQKVEDVKAGVDEDSNQVVSADESGVQPGKKIISFAFDQSTVMSDYGDMLWEHAQYLRQNNSMVLHVSGHTDASGARLYNEMLSKKRAEEVAQVLIDFGAPKEQIKIVGYASDQPLLGAKTHREHRRVELDYQQQQIVSN